AMAATTGLLQAIAFENTSDTPDPDARRLDAVISDGDGDTSLRRSLHLSVQATNDAPVAMATSIIAVPGIPVSGRLQAFDPEGDALRWELLQQAGSGSFVLHADGSFTYTAAADATGSDTLLFRVGDGLLFSPETAIQILISGSDSGRPQILSSAPLHAMQDAEWVYGLQVDTSALSLSSPTMEYVLFGDVPPGLVLQPTTGGAELRWIPDGGTQTPGLHYRFGVQFTETTSGTSGAVPIILTVWSRPRGDG
ncbi:MAG: Ig-like domain-containing protein, partial [Planctomycetota bacterium]